MHQLQYFHVQQLRHWWSGTTPWNRSEPVDFHTLIRLLRFITAAQPDADSGSVSPTQTDLDPSDVVTLRPCLFKEGGGVAPPPLMFSSDTLRYIIIPLFCTFSLSLLIGQIQPVCCSKRGRRDHVTVSVYVLKSGGIKGEKWGEKKVGWIFSSLLFPKTFMSKVTRLKIDLKK